MRVVEETMIQPLRRADQGVQDREVRLKPIGPLLHEARADNPRKSTLYVNYTHRFRTPIGCVSFIQNFYDDKPAWQLNVELRSALEDVDGSVGVKLAADAIKILEGVSEIKIFWCYVYQKDLYVYSRNKWIKVWGESEVTTDGLRHTMVKYG